MKQQDRDMMRIRRIIAEAVFEDLPTLVARCQELLDEEAFLGKDEDEE